MWPIQDRTLGITASAGHNTAVADHFAVCMVMNTLRHSATVVHCLVVPVWRSSGQEWVSRPQKADANAANVGFDTADAGCNTKSASFDTASAGFRHRRRWIQHRRSRQSPCLSKTPDATASAITANNGELRRPRILRDRLSMSYANYY